MPTAAEQAAEQYFAGWAAKDFAAVRAVLADDVTFNGPLAQLQGAEACVEGLRKMSEIVTDIEVHKRFVSGDDVLTWFNLHTSVADPIPTANWSTVRDGRIVAIRVTFDPRPLFAARE
ncbi:MULTISPECIES: nuclear transport factor 2 family protein [Thermocrispum]|uniref:Nuclear transport factor 2 family protein n=1 Tax=Thermocrispum agreste TaxID=37925 RepID=A0A2W4LCV7_9PSEU|nr:MULTISPECIES: nuclear transport factor 2 family protein [Thermocrispum]PZM98889.1 MAG: nuclear transport factor 2 family protein [Thermocrispum agreste]